MLSGYADSVDLFGIFLAIGGSSYPPPRHPLRTGLPEFSIDVGRGLSVAASVLQIRLHLTFPLLPVCLEKVKVCIALYGHPSQNYGASPAIWDHTVLPATRHR